VIAQALAHLRREARAAATGEFGDSSIPPPSGADGSGMALGERGAMAISTVMNCCRVLYDDAGILPFAAHAGDRYGAHQPLRAQPPIITSPFGPDVTRGTGFGQIFVSVALRGRSYLNVDARDRFEFPTQLTVLHPDKVQVRMNGGRKQFRSGTGDWVGTDQIKEINGLTLPGGITGIDPISYQRVTWGWANDMIAFSANLFKNGGAPSGVISVTGAGDRKKAREVKEIWEAGHAGVPNAHRPAVLFGGATWTPLSVTPENAQFLQSRAFAREDICGWFGVPLQRIQAIVDNASQGGGKGLATIDQGYATHTLMPVTMRIESLWDSFLPGGQDSWSLFDFAGLLRASPTERATIAQIHRLGGIRNRNQIRAEEGWAPIPGPDGENYNIPLNSNTHIPPVVEPGTDPSVVDGSSGTDQGGGGQ
jgi:HK97 family phage portal protein